MLTFTQRRNLFGQLASDTQTATLSLADTLMNQAEKQIISKHAWPFLIRQNPLALVTTASTQFYQLPANCKKLINVTVLNGTTRYQPREAPSRKYWDYLNQQTTYSSNFPEWYYVLNGTVGFWPIPSASSLTIEINYEITRKDLTVADYTTGTITTLTNGGTTVVGSGTSWTAAMAGRFIRVDESNTVANNGDAQWYEISSVTNSTTLVLVKPYMGVTLAAGGATYTIGQMMVLPDGYHEMVVYKALADFFASSKNPQMARAQSFMAMYQELYKSLVDTFSRPTMNPDIEESDYPMTNPNLFINS